ncbi:hypothetical protein K443DRAFT_191389 [Laccaria amethystina LaAM-08-1]|uniref:Uncharacterized protein n=1 Tax=Laccaria amethystina LaAM-08-1 TaxID=1095629 RepID=A0A0C9XBP4_9AGAR|nr:hypothetical protein K443DRAFT_191389 [Laccaria amethystina LaAM-08-1]
MAHQQLVWNPRINRQDPNHSLQNTLDHLPLHPLHRKTSRYQQQHHSWTRYRNQSQTPPQDQARCHQSHNRQRRQRQKLPRPQSPS